MWCAHVLQSIEREEPIEVDPVLTPSGLENGHTSTAGITSWLMSGCLYSVWLLAWICGSRKSLQLA